jgi:hypothetical protein
LWARLLVGSDAARTAEAADGRRTDTTDQRLRVLDADHTANHDRLRVLDDDRSDDDRSDYLGSDDDHDDLRRDVHCGSDDGKLCRDHDDADGSCADDVSRGDHRCDYDNHGVCRCRDNGSAPAEEDAAPDTAERGSQGRPRNEDDA